CSHGAGGGDCVRGDVGLVGVIAGVTLVIVLGRIEGRQRFELGDNWIVERLGVGQLFDLGLGRAALRFVGIENRRAVVCAIVVALMIQLRRIVGVEEDVQQLIVRDPLGIVGHADHLGMARVAIAHSLVIGRLFFAPGVAARDANHALNLLKGRLGAPKT